MPAVSSYVPDSPPAKLWELLRRNRRFRRVVERMLVLQERCESGSPEERRASKSTGHHILKRIQDNGNSFGHLALQWLVPQPLFVVQEAVIDVVDISPARKVAPLRFNKIGRGITPDPSDPTWKWFVSKPRLQRSASSQANAAGWPFRWGPRITTTISKDDRIKTHFHDGVAAWREWFAAHTFTVDTPWNHAPPDFQRHWEGLWNEQTGAHQAAFETNYFEGWSLPGLVERGQGAIKAANQCIRDLTNDLDNVRKGRPEEVCPPVPTRGGRSLRDIPQFTLPLSEVENTRMIQFSKFAGQRVLVLPRLMSKQSAHEVLRRLVAALSADLPRTHELLGTDSAWRVYLGIEQCRPAGSDDFGAAVGPFFFSRVKLSSLKPFGVSDKVIQKWVVGGKLKPLPSNPTPKDSSEYRSIEKAWGEIATQDRQTNRHFERWVQFLDQLSCATFPRLDFLKLERATPH